MLSIRPAGLFARHIPRQIGLSGFACVMLFMGLQTAEAQSHNPPSYLSMAARRINYATVPRSSWIRFGYGYHGGHSAVVGTSDFHAVPQEMFIIRGRSFVRLANYPGMVKFFEEEPKDPYQLTSTRNGSPTMAYKHDPDDPNWRERLANTVNPSPVVTIIEQAPADADEAEDGDSKGKDDENEKNSDK